MEVNHNNLPQAVQQIQEELSQLKSLLMERVAPSKIEGSEIWFDINELVAYDPEKRSRQTFYTYVSRREIPFHKNNKKLLFLKSEIDVWLKQGRKSTNLELQVETDNFLAGLKRKYHGK
jgi:hypothetical protein